MKKLILASLFFSGLTLIAHAQSTHDIMVGGGQDLIKTDNHKVFDKAQLGVEANYFIIRHFSVGAGAEVWTAQKSSFVMGMRWYANDNLFVRFRGLIGENDASLGAGWSQPVTKDWRIEGMGDFYFKGDFALRVGVAYVIH